MVVGITLFILLNTGDFEYGVQTPLPGVTLEQCMETAKVMNAEPQDKMYNKQGEQVRMVYTCKEHFNKT